MLRVTSINVNGIRAAQRKGFFDWLIQHQADVMCLQEVRISDKDLKDSLRHPESYTGYFNLAERKGYSGVGIYTKKEAQITHGMGSPEFDSEGRIIRADWDKVSIISAYLPSGSSSPERQAAKFRFLNTFGAWIDDLMADHLATGHEYIICGDWNMAHKNIDIKNWKGNLKNSGFTAEERAWVTDLLERRGFVDVFRTLNQEENQFTWWSNRGQAWANNVGWRIDYQIATPGIARTARHCSIYKTERFSDHAPLTIDYDIDAL